MTTLNFVNLYDILHVPSTASGEEIRKAITKERRQWVKRTSSADGERRAEAESRVRESTARRRSCSTRRGAPPSTPSWSTTGHPRRPRPSMRTGMAGWSEHGSTSRTTNANAANYAAREALNLRGDDHEAWFIRAHSSFLLGNARDAEYEFGEAIRLQPHNGHYHYGLGEIYAAQEKWRSALSEYEQALRLEPGNPEYRTSIAQVYLMTDNASKALEIMQKVVKEHPKPAFKFYLAIALHDSALDSLGEVRTAAHGRYVIISEAQATLMERQAGPDRPAQAHRSGDQETGHGDAGDGRRCQEGPVEPRWHQELDGRTRAARDPPPIRRHGRR